MSIAAQPLSAVQAELLRQILNEGNPQVGVTLEMLLGQQAEGLEVSTRMENLSEVRKRIPNEPMMSVKIGFEGDIEGRFIFMQPISMSRGLKDAISDQLAGHVSGTSDAASYVRGDWVQANRSRASLSEEKLRDVLGELSNVLFGNYLTAIYSRCTLATFQELPDVLVPDHENKFLASALQYFTGRAERCFLAEVDCKVGGHPIHFWLVMMAEPQGFQAMLEKMRKD